MVGATSPLLGPSERIRSDENVITSIEASPNADRHHLYMTSVLFLKNKTVPSDPYEELFTQNGYSTQFIPLLDHVHAELSFITGYLTSKEFLHDTDALIITSQRAVEALSDALDHLDPAQREHIVKKQAFTVGPATQHVLTKLGFQKLGGGEHAGNGNILADIILEQLKPHDRVTFFTGETRRDIIPRKLLSNGYNLKEVVIYRTVDKPHIIERFTDAFTEISSHPKQWIVFFSPQGTQEIVDYLKTLNLPSSCQIASIGPTTEEYLLRKGIEPNLVARKPEANSLLSGVTAFIP